MGMAQLPLPMYQTGVMGTAAMGPLSIQLAGVDGTNISAAPDVWGNPVIQMPGLNNTGDIDRGKGTAVKLGLNMDAFQAGVWYYGEEVSYKPGADPTLARLDANLTMWGIEAGMENDMLILQAQYLSTVLDPRDDVLRKDIEQSGWYLLGGVKLLGQAAIVARYDYINYDVGEEWWLDKKSNEESALTMGVNYHLNDNTCVGLNYTWWWVEARPLTKTNPTELAVILEVDLF